MLSVAAIIQSQGKLWDRQYAGIFQPRHGTAERRLLISSALSSLRALRGVTLCENVRCMVYMYIYASAYPANFVCIYVQMCLCTCLHSIYVNVRLCTKRPKQQQQQQRVKATNPTSRRDQGQTYQESSAQFCHHPPNLWLSFPTLKPPYERRGGWQTKHSLTLVMFSSRRPPSDPRRADIETHPPERNRALSL